MYHAGNLGFCLGFDWQTVASVAHGDHSVLQIASGCAVVDLAKKNTTIEVEIMESLNQIYKKHVKPEVREFIEELEGDEPVVSKKPRTIIEEHP